jgi:small-conductance mechanosensitive channel
VLIDRRAVLCKIGLCDEAARFRTAVRLVVNQEPRPAFEGEDAMFEPGSDAVQTAIRVPGARVEIAAVPLEGWGDGGRRWLIWAVAIPAALAAATGLLYVFLSLSTAVLKIWLGGLGVLVGLMLTLFQGEIAAALAAAGFGAERVLDPARLTLIALALAFAADSALAAYVWPPRDRSGDAMTRAPAILRSFVTVALYGLALLWASAFAFGLSLQGVGLTSGVLGIVVGIAVQRIILDFFSGVMLGVERPFRIGDWIEINNGAVRGTVTEMTWRTTTIRTPTPDHVLVPNAMLAQSLIVNRSRPTIASDAAIAITVDAAVPFDIVQAALLRAARLVDGQVPNLLVEPAPSVSITDLKDGLSTYRLRVAVGLGDLGDGKARAELFRATQLVFAEAGIPYGWPRSETRDAAAASGPRQEAEPDPTALSRVAA